MKDWHKVTTPPYDNTKLDISCFYEGGKAGRYKLEAYESGLLIHSAHYEWNVWAGHCDGRLLMNDFVEEATEKAAANRVNQSIEGSGVETVTRICDMRNGFKLQVARSNVDGDIHVSMMPEPDPITFDSVEFCANGTQSPHTYKALVALMEAMKKDATERPQA